MRTTKHHASNITARAPGVITPDTLYTLAEIKARLGWRDAAFKVAKRTGLKTHRAGKRVYVLGSDVIAYVTQERQATSCPSS